MKKTVFFLLFAIMLGSAQLLKAQILNPVKWSYAAKKTSNTTATIYIKATIEPGWHLYSQYVAEGGPIKTSINFTPAKGYGLIGKTLEPAPIKKNEPAFNMVVSFFEKSVVFQQKVKIKGPNVTVKGSITFMVCNDSQCLPPEEVEFTVNIK